MAPKDFFQDLHILLVDDHPPTRMIIQDVLKHLGIETMLEAGDGETALRLFREKEPDLVLLDWVMKPVSGRQVLDWIRTDPASPDITTPVLLVTAHATTESVREALNAGVSGVMVKPFSAAAMQKKILSVMAGRPLRDRDMPASGKNALGLKQTQENSAQPTQQKADEQAISSTGPVEEAPDPVWEL